MGMGGCSILMVLASAAVVGLMMAGTSGAQTMNPSPAPSSGVDCSGAFVSAANCLDYVSEGSNLTSPSSACCSGIEGLLTNSPVCLCQLLANSGSLGLPVDRKRALGLPNACKFSAPPLSACSLLGVPIPGPSEAPSPAESGGKVPRTPKGPASPSPSSAAGGSSEAPVSSSPSPAAAGGPSPDCSAAYMTAFSCLDYITSGSNQTSPSSDCCSGIKNLVTNEPVCLCKLLGTTPPPGISIDRKRALGLPNACKFSAPPLSACSLLGVPIPAPSEAPSPAESGGKVPRTPKRPASPSPSPAAEGSSEAPVSSSPSPAAAGGPSPDCNAAYMTAFSCLDYITSGSNQTSPDSACCSGIKNLISNEPVCLCKLLGATPPPGISVDRKRALGLPNACKVAGLPPSYCSKMGYSALAPSAAPSSPADAASTPGAPTSASEPATVASPGNGNSIGRFGFRPSVLLSTAIAMIATGATIAVF